ncbi:hypothetical protein VTO42DRAFT_168 [Malbranchea cinnamomea]
MWVYTTSVFSPVDRHETYPSRRSMGRIQKRVSSAEVVGIPLTDFVAHLRINSDVTGKSPVIWHCGQHTVAISVRFFN